MEKTIKGEIQAVSRYGGIKIDGSWYNPYPKDKERILDDKDKLAGSMVELALDNKGKVTGYTILEKEEEPLPEEYNEDMANEEQPNIPQNQTFMIRENALRHATSITTTYYNNLTSKQREHTTENDLTLAVIEQAEKLEKWIRR